MPRRRAEVGPLEIRGDRSQQSLRSPAARDRKVRTAEHPGPLSPPLR
eukprot:COSAG06_NODE_60481_length_270_cov_2.426901_1_plen_46_part_10